MLPISHPSLVSRPGLGARVTLRHATAADLTRVYEWFTASDLTREVMGPPMFPDRPALDFAGFLAAYPPHVFDGSRVFAGRGWIIESAEDEVGFLHHGRIDIVRDVV
jgi:hypothetical protein